MIKDINTNLQIINDSLAWADKHDKDSFPREIFKDYRRKLRRVGDALAENCSVAAYGESQVGKSYLMGSLLSSPTAPFVIMNKGVEYNFVDQINPSGGNNAKIESTGVITRFTIRQANPKMADYVRITNLSIVDLILLLADSYYNDIKIESSSVVMYDAINASVSSLIENCVDKNYTQDYITDDDIKDIVEYLEQVVGHPAVNVCRSNFCKEISHVIKHIPCDRWVDVFGILWNNSPEVSRLFSTLILEYKKLNFATEVYVPFEAVLRKNGTILKIDWLDSVCGIHKEESSDILYTDVFDAQGNLIAKDFNKSFLSALIGELTFVLPKEIANERVFLQKLDLLDFPGAKSREEIPEQKISEVLPTLLRRGKVAYLFNKYSRALKISSVLFCHHADHKTEPTIGSSINTWLLENIGKTPALRAKYLTATNGISPLFLICTKFNVDLERTKQDFPTSDTLKNHWSRFNSTIPKIIEPEKWMEDWVTEGGLFTSKYFRNVYLLRDFYWSGKLGVFEGYSDVLGTPETNVVNYEDFPDYFEKLRKTFLDNAFVKKHFQHPQQAWDDVATINNDGSKAIIRSLDMIANVLEEARRERYYGVLQEIKKDILGRLNIYYESDDKEENNKKVRKIVGDIKLHTEFKFGEQPELFGKMIDCLMVPSTKIRSIAYDILVRHIDEPQMVSSITMIRAQCGINVKDSREENLKKLISHYHNSESDLEMYFKQQGISIDDIISDDTELLSTIPDVIVKHIVEYWNNHINDQVKAMSAVLPHSDEIVFTILSLFKSLGVKKALVDKINSYTSIFDQSALINAIADYASLTLNNFVSSVGLSYMSDEDRANVAMKAEKCSLNVNFSMESSTSEVGRGSVVEVLNALEKSFEEINNSTIDLGTLNQLPFWQNYQNWVNSITVGLLYASDISHVDFVANAAIKTQIDKMSDLYI